MADNGIWFKLWIGADEDPDLGDLQLEDFARWCKFGLYLKKYGTDGSIELKEPCLALQHKFRVTSFGLVLACIEKFPNCIVTRVTNATVTWKNWQKYQGDNSVARVRKFRESVTAKKRREEMRGDEKRGETTKAARGNGNGVLVDLKFEAFYKAYPKKKKKPAALRAWKKEAALVSTVQDEIMAALEKFKRSRDWQKDGGRYIPYPATWLNNRCWEDEVDLGAEEETYEQALARHNHLMEIGYGKRKDH